MVVVAGEVEGELAAGDLADRDRAAHVQRVLGPEVLQGGGGVGDGGLEVEGVGEVEGAVDLRGAVEAVEVVAAGVDLEPAAVGGGLSPGLGLLRA